LLLFNPISTSSAKTPATKTVLISMIMFITTQRGANASIVKSSWLATAETLKIRRR
jgi:hypothetical protein